jgi:hypothetical protein
MLIKIADDQNEKLDVTELCAQRVLFLHMDVSSSQCKSELYPLRYNAVKSGVS